GLRWPSEVAPFDVHVVIANKDEQARAGAENLVEELSNAGLDVLFDDRKASPGVKFKDSELLGMPLVVVVGRGFADGNVEVRNRLTGESSEVPVGEAVREILGR
ncbi:MAG: His/Gly/Thr/Pro-type tRNA ligase C-terminal domain-containing protein, partial [Rhodococcus sp. (in: high G+C Gram-positive bacteria)]|uniref:His/Gly/Thr/Pro-type tRNA ligase C-terminal domain-containing protein n=2 Tax=unclassified Rhodococcus (in: high G+C Gram-positive bacteria) TaxID=192944 RepID=UPI003D9BE089